MDGNQNYTNPQGTPVQPPVQPQPATKFCKYCGATLYANAQICGACGRQQDTQQPLYAPKKYNGFSIAGFITSLFGISLLGLIFSIIGLTQIKKTGDKGKGFSIAGIIISIVSAIAVIIFMVVYVLIIINLMEAGMDYGYYYY